MPNFTDANLGAAQTNVKKQIALSFDIEDWFTVRNMRSIIHESQWSEQESRVQVGLDFILETLDAAKIKATFFILGWVAERSPELVSAIYQRGHRIGSHGYSHTPLDLMTPMQFEMDLKKSLQILESICPKGAIQGYRAPSFSITKKTAWAFKVLENQGINYDSSVFVTAHPDYGITDFPRKICKVGGLIEVPLIKSSLLGSKIPVCGGGYFRMLPYSFTKTALLNDLKSDEHVVMYFHPWEFDPGQPRVTLPLLKSFRHYVGLTQNQNKFRQLIQDFSFCPIEDLIMKNVTALDATTLFSEPQLNLDHP